VYLDCGFSHAHLGGDLFVEQAGDHPRQNLLLAPRKRCEALSQGGNLRVMLAEEAVALKRLMDSVQQILIVERLGEELQRPRLHRPDRHGSISEASDENDRNVNIGLCQLALEIEPTLSRQPDIEDQAARNIRQLPLQNFLRRAEKLNLQTYGADQTVKRIADRGVVIYNEHDTRRLAHLGCLPLAS
jgi:hypothetical protein